MENEGTWWKSFQQFWCQVQGILSSASWPKIQQRKLSPPLNNWKSKMIHRQQEKSRNDQKTQHLEKQDDQVLGEMKVQKNLKGLVCSNYGHWKAGLMILKWGWKSSRHLIGLSLYHNILSRPQGTFLEKFDPALQKRGWNRDTGLIQFAQLIFQLLILHRCSRSEGGCGS